MTWRAIYARPIARDVIQCIMEPSFLPKLASYDVASNICLALAHGGGGAVFRTGGVQAGAPIRVWYHRGPHGAVPLPRQGRAVQVDPIKPTFEALGTKRIETIT